MQPDFETKLHTLGETPKLTDWAKEPDLLSLKEDFEAAQRTQRDHITKIKWWRELMNVTGAAKPPKHKGRSSVQPRLIRRQAEWRYSALTEPFLSSDRMFKVDPVTYEDFDAAKQNELVLNWQFRTKLNAVKFIDEFVRTTVDEGTCIIRLGWCREVDSVEVEVPVWDYLAPQHPLHLQKIQEVAQLAQQDPGAFQALPEELQRSHAYTLETGVPALAQKSDRTEMVTQETVIYNHPTVQILNPENIYIDPSCEGDLDKARFIVVSFETSQAELKKDGRYKNLERVNWSANEILSRADHETSVPGNFQFSDVLRKRIVAYEYWGLRDIDGSGKLRPIVATWVGDTLVRMEANPFPDHKPPFVVVPYMPIKRSLYGETDAELLEDNQRIQGAVIRGMIDLMARSANSQVGMAKGMLDHLNKKRFDNGQDYEFNPVNHPTNGYIEHKYPELPRSSLEMVAMQNQEAEALTGVKAFSGGMSGDAYGDVAAGIRGMLDASAKREMAILRRLAKGMQEIGAKIVMMNQVFLSEQEVVRVTNQEFVTVAREDLAGNFDLIVDISTAEVDNAKAQDLSFMLQTIGPNMDLEVQKLILSEISDLKRMPALSEKIRRYEPKPDPLQEAELQKLQAEAQKAMAEAQQVQVEIQKINSEIQLNLARARLAQSQADAQDLGFVEQETGTKHERELQKLGAQARANQDLEVTKALLKPRKPEEKGGSVAAAVGYNELTDSSPPGSAGRLFPVR